jgi:hypothetical protein
LWNESESFFTPDASRKLPNPSAYKRVDCAEYLALIDLLCWTLTAFVLTFNGVVYGLGYFGRFHN